ncbi:VOC family protein [Burkholderia glumae]|uniref:VOC family protein n=1 Tax=Burkholderia glumae TaxID=337 RepID=UPI0002F30AB5|nr:VOC family protein [Burkholderia glumae]PJO23980.1 VOC family protein [Burkholderia glumae AU6208]QHE11268.1 VOC family protein [Burkholderia glumae AU6208]QJW79775.1 VOC family protein [Burkholderia glumae]RQZ72908.1 VOC family protein [Burkholderia glumae]
MTAPALKLDHLVVAARTLDEGTAHVADALGIEPAGGGAHPLMRTHNRLFGLWGGAYLEVIAIDTEAGAPAGTTPRPRLFALDTPAMRARLERGPALIHWVARVEPPRQLERWQRQYPALIAPVVRMQRGDWHWRLSVPVDGSLPGAAGLAGDGVVPSLIQWDSARHPSDALPHGDVVLRSLAATHPQAEALAAPLERLGVGHLISLATATAGGGEAGEAQAAAALVASFDTPRGPRTLR